MRLDSQNNLALAAALALSILLCSNQLTSASPQSGGNDKGSGGVSGSASVSGLGINVNANVEASKNGSLGFSSGASFGASQNGGGSISGSAEASASGGASGGSAQASASGSASISSVSSTTPKPEGLLEKVKDIFKGGKEMVKNSVETLTGGSQSSSQSSGSTSANYEAPIWQTSTSTPKPKSEGLFDKMADMAKKGKDAFESKKESIKETFESKKESIKESIRAEKENIKETFDSKKGEEKKGEEKGKDGESREGGFVDKLTHIVAKGTENVRDSVHKIEDKANEVSEKVLKVVDDNITKPMQSTSGSGQRTSEGNMAPETEASSKLRGSDREKYLSDIKRRQESELSRPSSLKEVVKDAKSRGIIPQNEDRSVLRGNHDDEQSMAVEVFDKAHEISKIPVETILRPLDKMLGYEKDPLIRMYDNSHELLRKPLGLVAKPVESVLIGAFKTNDEAKKENAKLLSTTSEQERKEAKMKEEKAKKEDRSVVGAIADRTVDLAQKPFELVFKPIDHLLGFDKDGKKSPVLRTLDSIYGLSKKPLDTLAKPFESILRKMADGDQMYEVSVRYPDNADPKLVTRLADGALNIADRLFSRPLEIVLKPLDHVLGFDDPGKKNPILEAAHSLKNATKVGVELWTKPIDRIIKEIADIGGDMNDAERDAIYERQKEDASRIVRVMDKFHDAAQRPYEIILRPVSKFLGTNKDGKKEPMLRAWDVIHQVIRAPIQVISKPVEDAIFGEKPRKHQQKPKNEQYKNGGESNSGGSNKNIFTDSIKKAEKFAYRPLDIITSPIRRLILGEDNEKVGSLTEKNNREIQAKSKASAGNNKAQTTNGGQPNGKGEKQPDKIVATIERMNNVMLEPLKAITQPISDILSPDKREKSEKKSSQGSRSGNKTA